MLHAPSRYFACIAASTSSAVCGRSASRSISLPSGADDEVALDAHADFFLGDVNARLDGEGHARLEHGRVIRRVVHIDADHVAESMDPVLAKRRTVQILAMRVDVVVGHGIERIRILAVAVIDRRLVDHEGRDRRLLRAEHNVVNLALPRSEVPVDRNSPGDVGRIHRKLARRVHHRDIAILHGARIFCVMQRCRVDARAHDGRVGWPLASLLEPHRGHFAGDGALGYAGLHIAHHGALRGDRGITRLPEQLDLALILYDAQLHHEAGYIVSLGRLVHAEGGWRSR